MKSKINILESVHVDKKRNMNLEKEYELNKNMKLNDENTCLCKRELCTVYTGPGF